MAAWKNRIISSGMVDPTTLNPNELNWRKHPDRQAKALSGTLDTLGWIQDIIVNEQTGRMIDGHLRVELAIKNKEKEVPVKYVDLSPEEEELALLTLDPIGAMAEADKNMLEALLNNCKSDDERIQALMGDIAQDYKIQKKVSEDDYEPPAEIETDIKRGDIFLLGRHRVMCGDSTSKEDVALLMDGKKVDACITDPPYNIDYGNIKHPKFKVRHIENDNQTKDDFEQFCRLFSDNIKQYNQGCIYVSGPPGPDGRVMFGVLDAIFHCSTVIIWNKDSFTLGRGKYQNKYEPIWFGWVDDGNNFYGDRSQSNVWDITRPKKSEEHPTMKPVELISRCIVDSSKDNQSVYDPFLGSGTTLIACEQLNRVCMGMEISPKYTEIICQRWEKLTGQTRQKINGDST